MKTDSKMSGIAKHPRLTFTAYFHGGRLHKTELGPGEEFICQFRGEGSFEPLLIWLKSYAKKKTLPFLLPLESNTFTSQVLEELKTIPFGSTASYGEIAARLNNPKASRAVGNACRGNPFPLLIPCHRVLGSHQKLGGFSCGLDLKRILLKFEDVIPNIRNNLQFGQRESCRKSTIANGVV